MSNTIRCSAMIAVRTVTGRNGDFKVAKISTPFFKEADCVSNVIEQLENGSYEAQVELDRIYIGSYVSGGRCIAELKCDVANIVINTVEEDVPEEPVTIPPDPLEQEVRKAEKVKVNIDGEPPEMISIDLEQILDSEAYATYLQQEPLRVDSTVPRSDLRQISTYLSSHGWAFAPREQVWMYKPN